MQSSGQYIIDSFVAVVPNSMCFVINIDSPRFTASVTKCINAFDRLSIPWFFDTTVRIYNDHYFSGIPVCNTPKTSVR